MNEAMPRARWRVVELEGIPVGELLRPDRLRADFELPDRPKILDIMSTLHIDSTGDDPLRVWVILDDDTKEDERPRAATKSIERAIREALTAEDIALFPYVRYRTKSEYDEESQRAS